MKRLVLATAAGLLGLAALPASAELERNVTLEKEALENGVIAAEWEGSEGSGLNTSWFLDGTATTGSCADTDEMSRCDSTLIAIDPDLVFDAKKPSTLTFRIEGFGPTDDYDLRVYESDENGKVGTYLGSPASDAQSTSPLPIDPRATSVGDYETVTTSVRPTTKAKYYLVEVVYFAVADGTTYTGKATLSKVPAQPAPEPAPAS